MGVSVKEVKDAGFVIDLHSTSSNTKDWVVVKRKNKGVRKLLELINPKKVIFMPRGFGDQSLINHCRAAVSFEYGRHDARGTYTKSLRDVKKVLISLGMIYGSQRKVLKNKTKYYKTFGIDNKPEGFSFAKGLSNNGKIKKGDILGYVGKEKVLAKEDFYPFLFKEEAYDFMGFKARKVKIL